MTEFVSREAPKKVRRAIPLLLATAMLGVVVLAGLLPQSGIVSAASNCTYGQCPASHPFPTAVVAASVAVVLIALLLALLLLRRSRRRPPSGETPESGGAGAGTTAGTQDWSEGQEPQSQSWDENAQPGDSDLTDPGTSR